jgi:hypothetical protein
MKKLERKIKIILSNPQAVTIQFTLVKMLQGSILYVSENIR